MKGRGRLISAWIETPNLPRTSVTLAVVSNRPELAEALEKRGVEPVVVRRSEKLAGEVSSHPDMMLHHLGQNRLVIGDRDAVSAQRLLQAGFNLQYYEGLKARYPSDIALNCARVGSFLFCLKSDTAAPIIEECRKKEITIIPVKQGYAKCSVCVVNDHALITADRGIYFAAIKAGFDALLIRSGFIQLDGYSYGFIGGCCGKLSPDTLAFTGDLRYHPDETEIRRFLKENGVIPICLSKEPLLDVGGILPLMQE